MNITITMPPSGAATNAPTRETAMLTIQPSTPRRFVQASWIATASVPPNTAAAITSAPPTLSSGIAPVPCSSRMPSTAMATMNGMRSTPRCSPLVAAMFGGSPPHPAARAGPKKHKAPQRRGLQNGGRTRDRTLDRLI
ncbi:hypothetical protein KXW36_000422 [Aspergillus fumigatus]|nr:hypothetical protein KXW36_000422 [Aspergillus fumigatus]